MASDSNSVLNIDRSACIRDLCLLTVILIMIGAAEICGSKEIIFPEVAALAIGSLHSQSLKWNINYPRMVLCITVCAILGVLIVIFLPGPLWIKFTLGYVCGQAIYYLSGTSLAPMISAICLPILVSTDSPVYIVAACILTLTICLIRFCLVRKNINDPVVFTPVREAPVTFIRSALIRTVIVAVLSFLVLFVNWRFVVAPPLLVAFTELSKPGFPAAQHKIKVISLVTLCGLAGAASREVISILGGQSLVLSALVTALLLILLLHLFKLPFPPAGAAAILALFIPDGSILLYPLQLLIGISVLVLASIPVSRAVPPRNRRPESGKRIHCIHLRP